MAATPNPPAAFVCPLTKKLMQDPVRSCYGYHYERSAILQWLDEGHNFCPVTGNPLRRSNLIPNRTLQWEISAWATEHCGGSREELRSGKGSSSYGALPPQKFICPLTQKVMTDPVMTKDGISFERHAILNWLYVDCVCPVTSSPLMPSNLVANTELQQEIEQWKIRRDETTKVTLKMGRPTKFCSTEMVTRDMTLCSMLRSFPTLTSAVGKGSFCTALEKGDLLSALNDALECSL
jgi:U-box domain